MREILDFLYKSAAITAGILMVGTLLMVTASMLNRYLFLDFLRGADMYAGYCMAGSGFLALAHTLARNEHIRVTLLSYVSRGRAKKWIDSFAISIGIIISGYLAWFSCRLTYFSYIFEEVSIGQDKIQLWIPQLAMVLGTVVFFIAFVDLGLQHLSGKMRFLEKVDINV